MDIELLRVRAISFMYEVGSMLLIVLVGVLGSEEFSNIITNNFGDTIYGGLILLIVSGIVKHLRNTMVIKQIELGGAGEVKSFTLI